MTTNTTIIPELLDQLLANYEKPEDLTGLFKQLKSGQTRWREYGRAAASVKAGLRPPPSAADGLDRTNCPARSLRRCLHVVSWISLNQGAAMDDAVDRLLEGKPDGMWREMNEFLKRRATEERTATAVGSAPSETLLTAGDIADRLSSITATPRDRLLERIKAWARGEFLKPLTDVAEEPVRFDEDTLYLAAVLCAMADMGLWAAHQRATVDTFSLSGFDLNKWRQARARGDEYPLFLVLTKERTEAEPRVQSTPTLPTGATAGLILDLDRIWSAVAVRRPGAVLNFDEPSHSRLADTETEHQ
jgi:hypothetical protein